MKNLREIVGLSGFAGAVASSWGLWGPWAAGFAAGVMMFSIVVVAFAVEVRKP